MQSAAKRTADFEMQQAAKWNADFYDENDKI
jgi:hypothetical protein